MDTLYAIVLSLHNIVRWLVIIFALLVLFRAYSGWRSGRDWTKQDNRASMLFVTSLDVQLLLGLLLYFVFSSVTRPALSNFGAAMSDAVRRFFLVEHSGLMVLALLVAHFGRSLARRAHSSRFKFSRTAIWFTIALVIILVAIPWPFMTAARPWLRIWPFF